MIDVLLVAVMMSGRPGTQIQDLSVCPKGVYGCADIQGNIIHMRPDLAAMLPRLNEIQPYQAALAVIVFCHEAKHLTGLLDERITQRWAVYHAPIIARLLGATKEWVARMRPWLKWWDRRLGE